MAHAILGANSGRLKQEYRTLLRLQIFSYSSCEFTVQLMKLKLQGPSKVRATFKVLGGALALP